MYHLAFILTSLGVVYGRGVRTKPRSADCPSLCRCEGDGMLWRVDCVDLGLRDVPSDLSGFTSCLDLSMNELSAPPAHVFSNLHALQELRLAGNGLTGVPKDVFAGLANLKVLMLQNNHLQQVPSEALESLKNLQSLRLDANLIACLPAASFKGLTSLRHLWLDDNVLTQVPVVALAGLPALQAVTLALNNITHIPDRAFNSLRHLVVLHLHDNQIHSLGRRCFDGLHNLETLDLSSNRLTSFPAAISVLSSLRELNLHSNNINAIPEYAFAGNPSLETINIQNNPVQVVGRSAFQQLPELRTLSLSGTTGITAFPDLTATNGLETLSITGTHISTLPSTFCEDLPNLQQLDLSHNLIQSLPSFSSCRKIQNIDLRHNSIHQVHPGTFQRMKQLRSLDLTSNRLSSISLEDLQGLTHLKLAGNQELRATLPLHQLPRLRLAEMPFQCCVCLHCVELKSPLTRSPDSMDNISKKSQTFSTLQSAHEKRDPEDWTVEFSVTEPQPVVCCSPIPGQSALVANQEDTQHLKRHILLQSPAQSSLAPWLVQFSVRFFLILSIAFNFLVLVSIFFSSAPRPPTQHLLGVLFSLHFFAGLSGAALDVTDTITADRSGVFGPPMEMEAGSGVTGFLFTLSSEACVFLTMAVVLEHKNLSYDMNWLTAGKSLSGHGGVRVTSVLCCALALAVTALPLVIMGEVSVSSPCAAFSHRRSVCWGYDTALALFNALCHLLMTFTHTCPHRHRDEVTLKLRGVRGSGATSMMTFLLLTNTMLSSSAALLSFSSLLHLPEVSRPTALLIAALPACLDPLIYMFLSPHFREELRCFLHQTSDRLETQQNTGHLSVKPEDADEQPCKSMLVSVSL